MTRSTRAIRLGTRASLLARTQSELVAETLRAGTGREHDGVGPLDRLGQVAHRLEVAQHRLAAGVDHVGGVELVADEGPGPVPVGREQALQP